MIEWPEVLTLEEVRARLVIEVQQSGITKTEFAEKYGLSRQYLNHVLNGRKPSKDFLSKLGLEVVEMIRPIGKVKAGAAPSSTAKKRPKKKSAKQKE